MAKHSAVRTSARRRRVGRLVAPGGLTAAAVSVTGLSSALLTGATTAVAPSVDLVALITPANSTSQIFAGTTYYGTNYTEVYGHQQVVPFFFGPQGIATAIGEHRNDPDPTGVTASGWGAGQTGTALRALANDDPDALRNVDLVILDNNTNRAGGGFWTTYSPFAPLLLTSAEPTPSDLGVPVLDVGYEYNINGDAPVDPLNPFAMANSLAAYAYGYGREQTAHVPQAIIDEAKNVEGDHYHYILNSQGEIVDRVPLEGSTTTYVTFESDGLPLVRPLRLLPGGDIVADALEPTLTALVNAGYGDGLGYDDHEAIPLDPRVPRPMQPGSSLWNVNDVPESVAVGFKAGLDTARTDVSHPADFVTKPIAEVGKLPVLSSLIDQPATKSSESTQSTESSGSTQSSSPEQSTSGLADDSPKKSLADVNKDDDSKETSATGASAEAKPFKRFTDRINDAVRKVTGGASGGPQKHSADGPKDSPDTGETN